MSLQSFKSFMTEISEVVQSTDGILSISGVFILLLLTFWRYVSANSKENKLSSIKTSFVSIVEQLSSSSETEQMSAAILLRRFFDTKTEMGLKGRPFKKEAVNLISGMLKVEPVGRLQKTLAEGLIYAVSVTNQDLQKVNLHDVHLGKSVAYRVSIKFRWKSWKFWRFKNWKRPLTFFKPRFTDFSGSDFFQSDLTQASFANCDLQDCVFYQANCKKTVFRNAKLMRANFQDADLEGAKFAGANLQDAKFDNAVLTGTDFTDAVNTPKSIKDGLGSNDIYQSSLVSKKVDFSVFVSKPAVLNPEMTLRYDALKGFLSKAGITTNELDRADYQSYEMLRDISTRIGRKDGVVIFGVADFYVETGGFRKGTDGFKTINKRNLSAPWTHIEAGMAISLDKPILLINAGGLSDGIYNSELIDDLIVSFNMNDKSCSNELEQAIKKFKLNLTKARKPKPPYIKVSSNWYLP